ncbi:MAG: phosphoribosylanthranilate isomerase [Gammaproteobacteria bacterium]|nr:MAG: phosphoribosylanthranilate isomerase [Gammaproteobacteria bacterium]
MLPAGLIQVAGIHDAEEARQVIDAGVRWLGFPLRLPVHAEDLSEAEAATVIAALPDEVQAVLITYLARADEIIALCSALAVKVVQLHGEVSLAELEALRRAAPGLAIIRSLVVGLQDSAALQVRVDQESPLVDAFITDTYDPTTGASGATGRTHDWQISRQLVARSPRPVILAGGLTPENVAAAIAAVQPCGVDVHTGVEDDTGRKCPHRLRRFVREATRGFR